MTTTIPTEPAPTQQPLRILVAEDSPLNAEVARKQLEALGYGADIVSDGSQVEAAMAKSNYSIILMDCQMPEMNGYEATLQIRQREQRLAQAGNAGQPVYVIAMTANTKADNREACIKAGMNDFINKPVRLPELEAALLRALAQRAARQAFEDIIDPVIIAGLRQLRRSGQADPLRELIDLFLREAPEKFDTMTDAVEANDETSLARFVNAVTSLKGSACNLGARHLAAMCDEIERAALSWSLDEALPLLECAWDEFERVRKALETIKQEPGTPAR